MFVTFVIFGREINTIKPLKWDAAIVYIRGIIGSVS